LAGVRVQTPLEVLRCPRPADKSLGDTLAGTSPAQELSQGGSGEAIGRDRGEEGEHRDSLDEVLAQRLPPEQPSDDGGKRLMTASASHARCAAASQDLHPQHRRNPTGCCTRGRRPTN
jgi:hypothetical protein